MITAIKDLKLTSLRASINTHLLPFYPRAKITTISVGNAFQEPPAIFTETEWPSAVNELDANSLYAEIYLLMKHLKSGSGSPVLKDGVKAVYDFTTGVRYWNLFEVDTVSSMAFAGYETIPAIFNETEWLSAVNELDANSRYAEIYFLMKHLKSGSGTPVLKDGVNAVYYRLRSEIPLRIEEHPFHVRQDFTTGVRYRNLFVDAVVSSMAFAGYKIIPVIFTETEWPSAVDELDANSGYAEIYLRGSVAFAGYETTITETGWPIAGNELDANSGYAEIYMRGLVKHLKSGAGTPLLKDRVKAVYPYAFFDKDGSGRNWGILYPTDSTEYGIDFSGASRPCLMNWINVALILATMIAAQVMNIDLGPNPNRPDDDPFSEFLWACEALSHTEEEDEDEVMEMGLLVDQFYEIDHSRLLPIPRYAPRYRFLEMADLRRIRIVRVNIIDDDSVLISYPPFRLVGTVFGYHSTYFKNIHGSPTGYYVRGIKTPFFQQTTRLSIGEARSALKMIPYDVMKDNMNHMDFYAVRNLY